MSKSSVAPVLSVRNLTRTYDTATGGLTVLRGVDLDIMPGEIVGLIGPSGSGKSSLLHAAGLLEHPTEGEVRIDGADAFVQVACARASSNRAPPAASLERAGVVSRS